MGSFTQLLQKERFFVEKIIEWGRENKRAFIWRERNSNFFIVFIAEFFLRKTKSETVDRFMKEIFLREFKTFCDLAQKDEKELREILKPLGLHNQRAAALKKISSLLCGAEKMPTYQEILELPHCGRYIANAVECFFYKRRRPIVDRNIQRVFHRFFSIPKAVEIHKADYLWDFAERFLPDNDFVNYNYYLLDFSAEVCKPRKPLCNFCPLTQMCNFYNHNKKSSVSGDDFHV